MDGISYTFHFPNSYATWGSIQELGLKLTRTSKPRLSHKKPFQSARKPQNQPNTPTPDVGGRATGTLSLKHSTSSKSLKSSLPQRSPHRPKRSHLNQILQPVEGGQEIGSKALVRGRRGRRRKSNGGKRRKREWRGW